MGICMGMGIYCICMGMDIYCICICWGAWFGGIAFMFMAGSKIMLAFMLDGAFIFIYIFYILGPC